MSGMAAPSRVRPVLERGPEFLWLSDRVGQLHCFLYITYNSLRLNILRRFAPEDLLNQLGRGGSEIPSLE